MIYLNGEKWKGSLKRLFDDESYDSPDPKEDKKRIRKILKAYGDVWCADDPFENIIYGKKVLIYAASASELEQLVWQADMEC